MKWSQEAERTMKRVPFFIRKMVRRKVEDYALKRGIEVIEKRHIEECKNRFMNNMDEELQGFSVETCLGADGCSNRVLPETDIADRIEEFLKDENLKEFLTERLSRPLKVHNEFRISISFCPNSCSRPQIVDIGLIGAVAPEVTDVDCSGCKACLKLCREEALTLGEGVKIDETRCLFCGHCVRVCPTSSLEMGRYGFRIQVGGKLGRHPQLGRELPGIFGFDEALETVKSVTRFYKKRCKRGERLGEVISRDGLDMLLEHLDLPNGEKINQER